MTRGTEYLLDDKAEFDDAQVKEAFFRKFNRLEDEDKTKIVEIMELWGKKKVKLPTTPDGWAVRVSMLVKAAREIQGLPRFPIDVAAIARDYSRNIFPKEPITLVHGEALGDRFEGALVSNPKAKGEWGIIFNSGIKSKGRVNFTLGHELGHYLLHRNGEPIYCSKRDMWAWDSAYGVREAEANRFASMLLMPLDDFRVQTRSFGGRP